MMRPFHDIWLKPGLKAFYLQMFQFVVVVKGGLDSIATYSPFCWAKGSDPIAIVYQTLLQLDSLPCIDVIECVVSFW